MTLCRDKRPIGAALTTERLMRLEPHGRLADRGDHRGFRRPTMILCDQGMNMRFDSSFSLKARAAAEAAALTAWIAFHAGGRVGGLVFNDQRLDRVPPQQSRQRVTDLLARISRHNRSLHAPNPALRGSGQLDRALADCLATARHDHTLFIVSDFSGMTNQTPALLQALSSRHEVIAVQVYDPFAVTLSDTGRVTVLEDDVEVRLNLRPTRTRTSLARFLDERVQIIDARLKRCQIPSLKISTGEPTIPQLQRALGLADQAPD